MNSPRPRSGMPSPAKRRVGRVRRAHRLGDEQQDAGRRRARTARYTSKTSVVGCGAYWANSPATSGPRPRPPMFAAVATSDARRPAGAGISSVSAAVAVPVIRPADSPETIRAAMSAADVGGQDEHDRAQRAGRQGHGHDRLAPGLVRGPPGQQQGGQHRRGVDGEGHRHHGRGEMPAGLVDDVQRGRQRGAEHGDAQHQRQQPERGPPGRPALSAWPATAGRRRPAVIRPGACMVVMSSSFRFCGGWHQPHGRRGEPASPGRVIRTGGRRRGRRTVGAVPAEEAAVGPAVRSGAADAPACPGRSRLAPRAVRSG